MDIAQRAEIIESILPRSSNKLTQKHSNKESSKPGINEISILILKEKKKCEEKLRTKKTEKRQKKCDYKTVLKIHVSALDVTLYKHLPYQSLDIFLDKMRKIVNQPIKAFSGQSQTKKNKRCIEFQNHQNVRYQF